ncbi:hypothetical protein EG68_06365 [Paragonimus skrjabini miyazakii]|uniref:N-acetylgalactosaminide beta-1,3-galactosyltransferase n=1 Tax=Paragonimus skrjabini miyazakii TaxID=59628 RepID=A0A8S9YX05_9TREM|nr:hypothetical protein EG68_06365 [Paragonimus skrjabini miyazakii]
MVKPKLKKTVRVWIALLKVAIGVLAGYLILVVKNHHKRSQNILLRSPVTFIQTHYSGLLQSTGLTTLEVSEPSKIRILCYINTYPANYHKKAEHTHQTWARKCTGHLYTSTQHDPVLPVAVLNLSVAETRNHLWSKMRAVLRHIYQYADQYDFFLKADDDTYVVMENMLAMLRSYSPEDRFMLGHLFPARQGRLCAPHTC